DVLEQIRIGGRREAEAGDHKDHWIFGSDDLDVKNDLSECVGSTGVPMNIGNSRSGPNPCENSRSLECQAYQLSFSSAHSGGVNAAHCDGSVHFINDGVDAIVWSNLGTRASQVNQ
ncbi:MAG: DUF1559 domain-containing protein, partial [Planctomycetota bacterium]